MSREIGPRCKAPRLTVRLPSLHGASPAPQSLKEKYRDRTGPQVTPNKQEGLRGSGGGNHHLAQRVQGTYPRTGAICGVERLTPSKDTCPPAGQIGASYEEGGPL